MSRKGENIFLRKDGRWEARYIKGYNLDKTKQIGYVYGKSYREVKNKRNDILLNINKNNKSINNSNKTINDITQEWLEQKKYQVKKSTYSRYLYITKKHIQNEIGNIKLKNITPHMIEKYIKTKQETENILTKKPLSSKTIRDIVVILKQIIKKEHIDINLTTPKLLKKKVQVLDIKSQAKLEEYLKNNINNRNIGILLCLYTGIRLGEICALKWSDIDLLNNIIYINHTIIRIKNLDTLSNNKTTVIIDEPKTLNSKRLIPIPPILLKYIKKIKDKNEDNYFLTNNNQFIDTKTFYNHYKKILQKLSIDNYSFHTLRHTFATRCIEIGFDPKTLSEILGHSDIKTTLSLYVHPTNEIKLRNMSKLKFLKN